MTPATLIKEAEGFKDSLAHEEKRRPSKALKDMTQTEMRAALVHHLRFQVFPPIRRRRTIDAIWKAIKLCAIGKMDDEVKMPAPRADRSMTDSGLHGSKREKPKMREASDIVSDLNLYNFVEVLDENPGVLAKARSLVSKAKTAARKVR